MTADGYTTEVEVVDLINQGLDCANLPNYPLQTLSAFGSSADFDAPIICAGHNATIFSQASMP